MEREAQDDGFGAGYSRREFMRLVSSMSAGTVIAGSLSGCAELWERQPVIDVEEWYASACRFCGTGCETLVGVTDGTIVDVKGDHRGHNRGRLCIKGILNREILYTEDRLLYPHIRQNGELVRASWDEAMELVAGRFREAIDEQGTDSVAYYGSGQLFTEESYVASKLFKAGIGTNNVDGNPRLCMASPAAGYTSVFGADEPMGCYDDIDHATCFFITGSNTAECHPIVWERIQDRKRRRPETFIMVVDPRRTRTARQADMHLPIRPGTDVALYNAMLHEFFRRDVMDQEMVEDYLTFRRGDASAGVEDLRAHLQNYSPESVATVCGVSADAIREAAWRFSDAQAAMSLWTMGLNQQKQGTACNRLVMAMHLLTGHLGRPGATCFSLTGQPNAGGGVRDTGALAHKLPAGRNVTSAEDRREMEELWNLPEGRLSPTPGYDAIALFQAMERGDVACCLNMATNPMQSLPNIDRYRKAVENAFFVVADSFHPTETTRYADVVLPAAMWMEKSGVFSQSERRYHYVPQVVEPPGEARSDFDMLIELADRLGHGDVFPNRTPRAIWDEWREISAHSYYNFRGITYDRLQEEHQTGLLWPCPDEDHPGTCRRYIPEEDPMASGEGRFDFYGRPDGRAVIFIHEQEEPADALNDEYPLMLTTGRVLEHWHTGTITHRIEQSNRVRTDFLEIHPADARERNISDGDPVRVESRRGGDTFTALITENIRRGLVFATFHSARHLINAATNDVVDPDSRQPDYKRAAVRISTEEATA